MSISVVSGPFGLFAETCECGRDKRSRNSFCRFCYNRLPPNMRHDLYKRVGAGYVESHLAARKYLIRNGVIQKREPITFGLEAEGKAS